MKWEYAKLKNDMEVLQLREDMLNKTLHYGKYKSSNLNNLYVGSNDFYVADMFDNIIVGNIGDYLMKCGENDLMLIPEQKFNGLLRLMDKKVISETNSLEGKL
jgi:hypothetical protein